VVNIIHANQRVGLLAQYLWLPSNCWFTTIFPHLGQHILIKGHLYGYIRCWTCCSRIPREASGVRYVLYILGSYGYVDDECRTCGISELELRCLVDQVGASQTLFQQLPTARIRQEGRQAASDMNDSPQATMGRHKALVVPDVGRRTQ